MTSHTIPVFNFIYIVLPKIRVKLKVPEQKHSHYENKTEKNQVLKRRVNNGGP